MSIENHPNFHASLFATRLMTAYREALRGGATKLGPFPWDETLRALIVDFVDAVDEHVDDMVRKQETSVTAYLLEWSVPDSGKATVGIRRKPNFKLNENRKPGDCRYLSLDMQETAETSEEAVDKLRQSIKKNLIASPSWGAEFRSAFEAIVETGEDFEVSLP